MDSARAIEIKIALIHLGKKQADIARELKVTPATVSDVINGRGTSRRVMTYIENTIKHTASKCPAKGLSAGQLCGTKKTLRDKQKNIMVKVG